MRQNSHIPRAELLVTPVRAGLLGCAYSSKCRFAFGCRAWAALDLRGSPLAVYPVRHPPLCIGSGDSEIPGWSLALSLSPLAHRSSPHPTPDSKP